MKTYAVELQRVSYITLHIEANDQEEAERQAWEQLDATANSGNDAAWTCTSIEEFKQ